MLDALPGNRPSTKPAVVVDTLKDSEDEAAETTPETEGVIKEGQDQTSAQAGDNDQALSSTTPTPIKRSGKIMVREDKIEHVMKDVVQQIFLNKPVTKTLLNSKRLKFQEHLLEKD